MSTLLKQIKLSGNSVNTKFANSIINVLVSTYTLPIITNQAQVVVSSSDVNISCITANIPLSVLNASVSYIEIINIFCNTASISVATNQVSVTMFTDYKVQANTAQQVSTTYIASIDILLPPALTGTFDILDSVTGTTYNYDLNSLNTGGVASTWAWSGTPPTWANLDVNTGIITGTSTAGTWAGFSVVANNATSNPSTSNTDSVTINEPAPAAPINLTLTEGTY